MIENLLPETRNEYESMDELKKIVEEKDKLVKRQFIRIEVLENEVATLQQERDALLCDINKLRFELEMSELKRIKDNPQKDRPPPSLRSLPISQSNHGTEGEAALSFLAYGPGQKSVDRPQCGPGPPLKQLRSYSVDNTSQAGQLLGNGHAVSNVSNQNPAFGRSRQRSVSGHVGPKKTPVRRLDEEALKRTRIHANQYELSQDLLDKQVEMLERKYGGVKARHAALTIQRAFRKHCMVKRFQDIANASKGEKRLSRRVYALELENKEWILYKNGSSAMTPVPNHHHHPHYHHHHSSRYNYGNHQRAANPIYETETDRPSQVETTDGDPKGQYSLFYEDGTERHYRSSSSRERNRSGHRSYSVTPIEDNPNHSLTNGSVHNNYQGNNVSCHCATEDRSATEDSISGSLDAGNDSVYYTPPTRLPNWSNSATSNIYANSSQMTPEVPVLTPQEEHYHTPRESLSSEDSAISSSGAGDELSDIRQNSLPRDLRRSSNNPRGSILRQPTPEQMRIIPARPGDSSSLGRRASSNSAADIRKVPPQIPKRTCSIIMDSRSSGSSRASPAESLKDSVLGAYDASSVSSSGSTGSNTSGSGGALGTDSSVRQKTYMVEASPVWKRKSLVLAEQCSNTGLSDDKRLSNISENSEDSLEGTTVGVGYCGSPPNSEMMLVNYPGHSYGIPGLQTPHDGIPVTPLCGVKVSEVQRKRQYRVGLNLFNKKPERGIRYLILRGFLEGSPQAVARFLISRKGLSKQMIGEYLGNLMSSFNMAVLEYFVQELDLAGMQVDVALRKFQTYFRLPGEAQKIERLMEVFSHRFVSCNRDIVSKFTNPDTVFVLAFAIIMLNTDLHTPTMKAEKRMKGDDFIKNLRGVDDGHDLDRDMLNGIYERIKANEFKPGSDHVTQVLKVQQTIVGKKPNLALPHRRLVCYCRLYEVFDVSKKERPGVHQREVFLFNDMLMVTKIFSKKKNSVTYTFRQSFPLCGMSVTLFEAPYYPHGIRLSQRVDDKVLVTFNARNEHDRSKFVEDLKESILEMDEMENLRIEAELEKQQQLVRNLANNNPAANGNLNAVSRVGENRDSGVADMEILPTPGLSKDDKLSGSGLRLGGSTGNLSIPPASGSNSLKRSALSNSLLDLHEQQMSKPVRRGSAGSLDSGMSVSFQSSAASTVSRDSSPQTVPSTSKPGPSTVNSVVGKSSVVVAGMASAGAAAVAATGVEGVTKTQAGQPGFLGNLFGKKTRSTSKVAQRKLPGDSSDA